MIVGSKVGQVPHVPQLHIEADKSKCISCKKGNSVCPMGLDVEKMVAAGTSNKCSECIQCGACVDICCKKAIRYSCKKR